MDYIEYKISFNKYLTDDENGLIMSDLEDIGFESFVEEDLIILSYITVEEFVRNQHKIESYFLTNSSSFKNIEKKEIVQQNWNALWEANFTPTQVNEQCVVRAPFHEPFNVEYELVIMPKMSFGTGHHETTRLMMLDIFEQDLIGKKGLDMGCGTGVLGILAAKRGAKELDIIDIDRWAYENAIENVEQNNVLNKINVKIGDASLLKEHKYQFILANINRNILLNDMEIYFNALENDGTLTISGFLKEDIDLLRNCAEQLGLTHQKTNCFEKWQIMRFVK